MKKKFICMMAFVFCCSFMMPAMAVDLEHVENPSFPIESTNAQYEVSGDDTFEAGTYVGESYRIGNYAARSDTRAVSFPNQGTILWKNISNDGSIVVTDQVVHNYGVNYSHQFVTYLTDAWAKVSQYNVNRSEDIRWTTGAVVELKYHNYARVELNLESEVKYSLTVGYTIPADSSKYSKLGLSSDYVGEYFYREILYNSQSQSKLYDSFKAPVKGQQYVDVIYQG